MLFSLFFFFFSLQCMQTQEISAHSFLDFADFSFNKMDEDWISSDGKSNQSQTSFDRYWFFFFFSRTFFGHFPKENTWPTKDRKKWQLFQYTRERWHKQMRLVLGGWVFLCLCVTSHMSFSHLPSTNPVLCVCVCVCVCVCERERKTKDRADGMREKVPIALDGIRTCISGIRAHSASNYTTTAGTPRVSRMKHFRHSPISSIVKRSCMKHSNSYLRDRDVKHLQGAPLSRTRRVRERRKIELTVWGVSRMKHFRHSPVCHLSLERIFETTVVSFCLRFFSLFYCLCLFPAFECTPLLHVCTCKNKPYTPHVHRAWKACILSAQCFLFNSCTFPCFYIFISAMCSIAYPHILSVCCRQWMLVSCRNKGQAVHYAASVSLCANSAQRFTLILKGHSAGHMHSHHGDMPRRWDWRQSQQWLKLKQYLQNYRVSCVSDVMWAACR